MKELIESVATRLGWEVSPAPGRNACVIADRSVDLPGPRRWYFFQPSHTHLGEPDRQVLILFAAYAKAEMAKRGWIITRFDNPHRLAARMVDRMERTDPNLYDPTDPLSEAVAVLRSIDDALKPNPHPSPAPDASPESPC